MRGIPGRLVLALALTACLVGGALAQTARVGWDGTWAGGWDQGNGVQLVFAGEALIAFYWRNDYKSIVRSAASPDGRTFVWDRGDATLTRGADGMARLGVRERGKPEISVSLKRE